MRLGMYREYTRNCTRLHYFFSIQDSMAPSQVEGITLNIKQNIARKLLHKLSSIAAPLHVNLVLISNSQFIQCGVV